MKTFALLASVLILGGCVAGSGGGTAPPADPSNPGVVDPIDAQASQLGALLTALAEKYAGPAGALVAGIALPLFWGRIRAAFGTLIAKPPTPPAPTA